MRFVPITKEEREYMNATGNIPDSVTRMTDGCTLGVYTPEQKKAIEEQREREQARLSAMLVQQSVEHSQYSLSIFQQSLDHHFKKR